MEIKLENHKDKEGSFSLINSFLLNDIVVPINIPNIMMMMIKNLNSLGIIIDCKGAWIHKIKDPMKIDMGVIIKRGKVDEVDRWELDIGNLGDWVLVEDEIIRSE